MKNFINEKNKLPLTFKYVETIKKREGLIKSSEIIYYIECKKYGTDFYMKEKPIKSLVRLL
ncbi:hypothetical protein CW752_03510 [Chryseobacterium sp. PMSZPI]|nr:hypothetical protein CW752_03510 [Chryseobacterium sp. PMSZPI]